MLIYLFDMSTIELNEVKEWSQYLSGERLERFHRSKLAGKKLEILSSGLLSEYVLRPALGTKVSHLGKKPYQKDELSASVWMEFIQVRKQDIKDFLDNQRDVIMHSPLPIVIGENGKPFLKDSDLHFNISHSGDYIVCVVDRKSVGVDIQKQGQCKNRRMAERFFSKKEAESLRNLSEAEYDCRFTRLWAAKESYLKLTGRGLGGNLSGHMVDFDSMSIRDLNGQALAHIAEIDKPEGYRMCICFV